MRKTFFLLLIAISLIFSLFLLWQRFKIEENSKSIQLILDYDDFSSFLQSSSSSEEELLRLFKARGINTIALSEINLKKLSSSNKNISVYRGGDLIAYYRLKLLDKGPLIKLIGEGRIHPEKVYVFVKGRDLQARIESDLKIYRKYNKLSLKADEFIFQLSGNFDDLIEEGLGFDEKKIEELSNGGFSLILRPENKDYMPPERLKLIWDKIDRLSQLYNISGIIFGGKKNEVIGYPASLDMDVQYLKKYKGRLGLIEVYQKGQEQKGIKTLSLKVPEKCIRVQSIPEIYLEKLSPPLAKEMFLLGIKERNIRWIYLRLFNASFYGNDLVQTNLNYIQDLSQTIASSGFNLAQAIPFSNYRASLIFILLISLGAVSGLLLLLGEFFRLNKKLEWIILPASLLCVIFLWNFGKFSIACKILALLAALTFPALALIYGISAFRQLRKGRTHLEIIKRCTSYMAIITGLTLIGGIQVAALLSGPVYWLGIDGFKGVKLLMILPPVIVYLWYYTKGINPKPLWKLLGEPLLIKQAASFLILALIGIVYITRTGNTDMPVLGFEKQMRIFLSHLLVVRPRFKDIFIGFPSLMLLLGKLSLNSLNAAGIFLLFAAIGQADIIDSFAHLHTPIFITVLRISNGFIIGWLIGLVFLLALLYSNQERLK